MTLRSRQRKEWRGRMPEKTNCYDKMPVDDYAGGFLRPLMPGVEATSQTRNFSKRPPAISVTS